MDDAGPDMLQTFLTGRDVPCPGCGYNLRDLPGGRCPECGDDLVLQVGLLEPRQAAGIAGLIALAAGAGLNGLLLGYVVIRRVIVHDNFSDVDAFLGINAVGLVIEAMAIFLWLRLWRRIRRSSRTTKWALVLGCCALTITNLFVFSLFIK